MGSKRSDIQAQIDALTQELENADDDEDFEVEIFKDGKGARLPFRHSKQWLTNELGISFDKPGAPAAPQGGTPPDGGTPPKSPRARARKGDGDSSGQGVPDQIRGYFPGAHS